MGLVIAIDIVCAVWLTLSTVRRGFEETLPVATFLLMLFPGESFVEIPGLFVITTQRLIVLTLLGLYLVFGRTPKDGTSVNKLPIFGLLALQIIWMGVSTANSVVFTVSLKATLSQLLDYFVLFFLVAKSVRTTETIHKILMGYVAAMIFLSFFAVIEVQLDWSLISLFPVGPHRFNVAGDVYDRVDRVRATFDHPILFGGALALAIPIALYLIRIAKNNFARIGISLGIGVMFYAIYKTSSRGPWLALLMSCVGLGLLGGKQLRKYLLYIGAVVALTLVVRPGILTSLVDMYTATKDPDSPMGVSYQWRYALYDLVRSQLGKSPARAVWGYGPESFYYLGLTTDFYLDGEIRTVKVESCDSSVAALMMETGYVGFLITSLMLLAPLLIAVRTYLRSDGDAKTLLVLFVLNLGSYYFLMTNVAIYGWGQQSYMLWTILAMTCTYPSILRAEAANNDLNKPAESDAPVPRVWGTPVALPSDSFGSHSRY